MILPELSHDPAANLRHISSMSRFMRSLILLLVAGLLPACATVEIPDLGQNLADFRDNLGDLDKDYMQAEELRPVPTDIRSAEQWDDAAREMQSLQEGFKTPPFEPSLSDEAFEAAFESAQDYAKEYKDDDPQ